MHPVIHFRSRLFDLAAEPENPINPIRGASVLQWLRKRLPAGLQATEVEAEDWGWYFDLDWHGRPYLIGASAEPADDGLADWMVQIDKRRNLKERLLGQARMTADDPCLQWLRGQIESEPAFDAVSVELGD